LLLLAQQAQALLEPHAHAGEADAHRVQVARDEPQQMVDARHVGPPERLAQIGEVEHLEEGVDRLRRVHASQVEVSILCGAPLASRALRHCHEITGS